MMNHGDVVKAPDAQHSNASNEGPVCRGQQMARKWGEDNGNTQPAPTSTPNHDGNHDRHRNNGKGGTMARGGTNNKGRMTVRGEW